MLLTCGSSGVSAQRGTPSVILRNRERLLRRPCRCAELPQGRAVLPAQSEIHASIDREHHPLA